MKTRENTFIGRVTMKHTSGEHTPERQGKRFPNPLRRKAAAVIEIVSLISALSTVAGCVNTKPDTTIATVPGTTETVTPAQPTVSRPVKTAEPVAPFAPEPIVDTAHFQVGYRVDSPVPVKEVSGDITLPDQFSCGKPNAYFLIWDGIQSSTNTTVAQVGADVECKPGKPVEIFGFYEMYPRPLHVLNLQIQLGDTLYTSVRSSGYDDFVLNLRDERTNQQAKKTVSCPTGYDCDREVAEFIGEVAPGPDNTLYPLAIMDQPVVFTDAMIRIRNRRWPLNSFALTTFWVTGDDKTIVAPSTFPSSSSFDLLYVVPKS